jgi:hypothetical protein
VVSEHEHFHHHRLSSDSMNLQANVSTDRLRVHCFGVSLDGYGAGPNQSLETPLGVGGESLHAWLFPTRTLQRMRGAGDGTTGVDDEFVARGFGSGAPLFGGIDALKLGYECAEHGTTPNATHVVLRKCSSSVPCTFQ